MSLTRADAIHIPLRDESVDIIITSPPYFALRSYTDGGEHYGGQIGSEPTPQAFLEALWAVTAEMRRVLKPSGSIWVNLGDKYSGSQAQNVGGENRAGDSARTWAQTNPRSTGIPAKSLMGLPWRYAIGCIDQLGLILRAEVVWSKPNGLPESVTDRVRRSHEQWFHFVKQGRYYSAIDEIREAHQPQSIERTGRQRLSPDLSQDGIGGPNTLDPTQACNPLGKLPGSVWTIPSEPLRVPDWLGVDHFAAYPQEWPRRLILGWSPPGICTECGQGRRPIVAKELEHVSASSHAKSRAGAALSDGHRTTGTTNVARESATITGYGCDCPTPTAPTRPAIVLDPFGGTGTTAMVARTLGRYPIHLDLSADYLKLARWRIYDSGHAAKTEARTHRERQGVLL